MFNLDARQQHVVRLTAGAVRMFVLGATKPKRS
jgi:hypothetical protein